mgnify:FL=1
MEIKVMNKTNAQLVRKILNENLPSILEKHGLSFELGNAKYDDDGVKFTSFRLSVKGALSETEKALENELNFRDSYGLKLDQNKIAKLSGMNVSLIGYKPRARKNPFIIQDLDTSKEYVISEQVAIKLFKAEESIGSLTLTDMQGNPIKREQG